LEGRRLARLAGQIQEEVSDIMRRRLKDPRLGFVSVTRVKVTADLSYANVYVSVIGEEKESRKTMECLEGASSLIRSELGKRIRVKRIPELRFYYDDSSARSARIEEILKNLKEAENGREL
jgi:ribosome-binding factor A